MDLFTKQKQAQRHRKEIYGCQRGEEGRDILGQTIYKVANQQSC